MYFPVRNFNSDEFIQTPTGVKVSRSALMCSPQNLEMPGGKVSYHFKGFPSVAFYLISQYRVLYLPILL